MPGKPSERLRKWFVPERMLERWAELKRRRTGFHLTQLLTGHGFAVYLKQIGREAEKNVGFVMEIKTMRSIR